MKLTDIDIPPDVAGRFLEDMHAFFSEPYRIKRDEIAGRQMFVLREYQRPREKKLRNRNVHAVEG